MSSVPGIVRTTSFTDNFLNENDQDANSALTELDKGLRSPKIGEQCEAIVRYPKLFEKYPFPILINASFLKLADFFRGGSNLLRLWVLRVCQQSEKHLDKILSVDEFVKRIFMVTHSNDPIARALTLRTLGAVAGVIPEKPQVHHAIRRALDSHDTVEVEAAIQASVQFAAQSKTFAISMCSKVASMIESLQTPIAMKLQLIPVLRHMHHDASTAALVKTVCLDLLPKYPSESFVIVILDSLTQLTCATVIDIPDQVNLLLNYLHDPRKKVRYQVLRSLHSLAETGAHLWPKGAQKRLISIAMSCSDLGNEQSLVLSVVLTLTNCPFTCHSLLNEEQKLVLELCSSCLVLEHHTAASQALGILTSLVCYCYTEGMAPPLAFMEQINLHLESLIYSSLMDEKLVLELSKYLKCGVRLSEQNLEFARNFVDLIGGLLTDDYQYAAHHSILLCETLGALCAQFCSKRFGDPVSDERSMMVAMEIDNDDGESTQDRPFAELLPRLLKKLQKIAGGDETAAKENSRFIEILAAVCLQSMLGCFMPETALNILQRVLESTNNWTQYRIARSSSRYGHHLLAAILYQRLSNSVSLEKFHFFLSALAQMSRAECILIYGYEYDDILKNYTLIIANEEPPPDGQLKPLSIIERLDKAIALYWKALATLKASSSPGHPLTFQSEFVRLRGQFLEALYNVVIVRNTQAITPPPAIAQTLAQNSRDHLQKFGHITNQLRKNVKIMKTSEDNYGKLYSSAFDADPCTLEYLEISKYISGILGHSIESICFISPSDMPNLQIDAKYPETKYMFEYCRKIVKLLGNLPAETGNQKTITNKHTDTILAQIEMVTRSTNCIPRFFFQVLQNTTIKLSLSPQPRTAGEPVVVQNGSNLVVKVEGVIQHSGKTPSLYRSIDLVQLTIVSQLLTQRPNEIKPLNDTVTLTQTVKPHRDFLTGSFLLPLSTQLGPTANLAQKGGQWQVTLEACVIDGDGVLWNTGPKSVLLIRVPDDPNKPFPDAIMNRRPYNY